MTYSLEFDARALKEWQKLGDTVRQQLKKKLAEVLLNPRIEANRLHSLPDCYKRDHKHHHLMVDHLIHQAVANGERVCARSHGSSAGIARTVSSCR